MPAKNVPVEVKTLSLTFGQGFDSTATIDPEQPRTIYARLGIATLKLSRVISGTTEGHYGVENA